MNSKLLFAATVAISLLSTVALADQAPLTRAQVKADLQQAIANHTLQRTDYDVSPNTYDRTADRTRAEVVADLTASQRARQALVGPNANSDYNPAGTAILAHSTLPRGEVKAEVLTAAAAGTLPRAGEAEPDSVARRVQQNNAPSKLAQRVKALFVGS